MSFASDIAWKISFLRCAKRGGNEELDWSSSSKCAEPHSMRKENRLHQSIANGEPAFGKSLLGLANATSG